MIIARTTKLHRGVDSQALRRVTKDTLHVPRLGLQTTAEPRISGAMLRVTTAILVLVLASFAVPLEASQPTHLHKAGVAGLYNEEHVLASLDSLSADAPLPVDASALWFTLVVGASILAGGARHSAPPPNLAGSRAPPLA